LVVGINWLWTDHRWAIWAIIGAIELLLAVPTISSVSAWVRYDQARTLGGVVTIRGTRALGYFALSVASAGILANFVFFLYNFVPLHEVIPSMAKPSPVWWILGTALLSLYVFFLSGAVARRVAAEQQLQEELEREKREQARRAEQRREEDQKQRDARERSRQQQENRRQEQAKRARAGSGGQQNGGNRKNSSNGGRDRVDGKWPKGGSAHEILQVSPDASKEEIVAAYRRMVRMYHPDKVSGLAPEYAEIAERKMKEINAAYAHLKPKR
jgi:DnaJ-domain-containing protein 1